MFLLILFRPLPCRFSLQYLHSTMFLLIRSNRLTTLLHNHNLHSTMFLLIPDLIMSELQRKYHLHSTMFLLIPIVAVGLVFSRTIYIPLCFYLYLDHLERLAPSLPFTFHYVSTYTHCRREPVPRMHAFTFHYVSTYTLPDRTGIRSLVPIYIPLCFYLYISASI